MRIAVGLIAIAVASLWAAGSAVGAGAPQPGSAENEGIIFERQNIMTRLERDAEELGNIVAGVAPKDRLAAVTRSIANGARDSLESFRAQVPGGHSKPAVWSDNADFMRRMEAFARNSEAMAKAGETGNVLAVTGLLIDAMPCKQCHDLYREPKKR